MAYEYIRSTLAAMKKRYASLSWCLLLSIAAMAQQPFLTHSDEPVWNVQWTLFGIGTSTGTLTYSMPTSASIDGVEYSVLGIGAAVLGYYRNEGDKTYFRRPEGPEFLAYDYSLTIGDTAFIGVQPGISLETIPFKLENIESVVLNGISRRRFTMRFNPNWTGDPDESLYGTMHWVEGIGSTWHPFFHLACIHDGCETTYSATCVDSLGLRVYQAAPNCFVGNVGVIEFGETSASSFKARMEGGVVQLVYPDRFRNGALTIRDPKGRVLITKRVNEQMRDVALPISATSVLLAELVDEHGARWAARFVVAHH
ncbi:MAG: hypothetical protein WAT74_12625 [Flavobacteriales bacterium]